MERREAPGACEAPQRVCETRSCAPDSDQGCEAWSGARGPPCDRRPSASRALHWRSLAKPPPRRLEVRWDNVRLAYIPIASQAAKYFLCVHHFSRGCAAPPPSFRPRRRSRREPEPRFFIIASENKGLTPSVSKHAAAAVRLLGDEDSGFRVSLRSPGMTTRVKTTCRSARYREG
jgi:hypothetical protein